VTGIFTDQKYEMEPCFFKHLIFFSRITKKSFLHFCIEFFWKSCCYHFFFFFLSLYLNLNAIVAIFWPKIIKMIKGTRMVIIFLFVTKYYSIFFINAMVNKNFRFFWSQMVFVLIWIILWYYYWQRSISILSIFLTWTNEWKSALQKNNL